MELMPQARQRRENDDVINRITSASPFAIRRINAELLAANTIITDFLGQPALFITVTFPREITRIGLMSIRFAIAYILLAGALAMCALAYFVHRIILSPLFELEQLVLKVRNTADYSIRTTVRRNDEIGVLAQGFNLMLEKTETQNLQLDLFIEELKTEIDKRAEVEERLRLANSELEKLTRLDPLTHIANRRHFAEVFAREWQRLKRNGSSLSAILCDIDYFKNYNDLYGHPKGDICLKQVAELLVSCARRPTDCVARYGGEEFIILLPETTTENAFNIAENMRKGVEGLAIPHQASPRSTVVTLSLGLATGVVNDNFHPDELIQMADKALYKAKEQGRNCTVIFSPSASKPDFSPSEKPLGV